jgi:hypothetical protein
MDALYFLAGIGFGVLIGWLMFKYGPQQLGGRW